MHPYKTNSRMFRVRRHVEIEVIFCNQTISVSLYQLLTQKDNLGMFQVPGMFFNHKGILKVRVQFNFYNLTKRAFRRLPNCVFPTMRDLLRACHNYLPIVIIHIYINTGLEKSVLTFLIFTHP